MIDPLLAPVSDDAHKYSRGIVGVAAGSDAYAGAAVLCVGGARRGGAGYVRYLERSERAADLVLRAYPDVVVTTETSGRTDAWVIGSGMTPDDASADFASLHAGISPLVIDGGALTLVTTPREAITILTPHEGEAAHMGFPVPGHERIDVAAHMAATLGAIVVLKGPGTVIASPDGRAHIDHIGGPELSTAGTGDILAGLIASMLASWQPQNIDDAFDVAVRAVTRHGHAGKRAAEEHSPVVATDVLESLSHATKHPAT
jgi:ADP-dependent NAD(P)H-hydrate dehydratase / NAD(P)H-hydrate epimerase